MKFFKRSMLQMLFVVLNSIAFAMYSQSQSCSGMVFCDDITTQEFINLYKNSDGTPKRIPFDWESCECRYWYARSSTNSAIIKLPSPFYSGVVSRALSEIKEQGDYKKANGWELLLHDFGQESNTNDFYFILYNKHTAMMRLFWYNQRGAYNVLGSQKASFTLSYNGNKPTCSVAFNDQVLVASDQYLNNNYDGKNDLQTYIVPIEGTGPYWIVAEFQLGFDSFMKDLGYTNSAIQIQIAGLQSTTVSLQVTGTSTTKDMDQYMAEKSATSNIPISGKGTKNSASTVINKVESYAGKATEYINKADSVRVRVNKVAQGIMAFIAPKAYNNSFLDKNVATPMSKLFNLTSDKGGFTKVLGVGSKVLSGFTGGVDFLKTVGSVFGVLSGAPDETGPTPTRPTITSYDLKVNGNLELSSPQKILAFKVPGTQINTSNGNDNRFTYYDCAVGVMSLDNIPILKRIIYNRTVESIKNEENGSFVYYGRLGYASHKLVSDLNFSLNEASGLEIVDLKAAIVAEGSIDLAESFNDTIKGLGAVGIKTRTGGEKVYACDGQGCAYKYTHTYFNNVIAEIGSNMLELHKYDPKDIAHTVGTTLIDYRRMKGMTLTVPANMEVNIRVTAIFRKKNDPNSAPIIFSKLYKPKFEDTEIADNLGYLSNTDFFVLPPFTNYTNRFTSPNFTFNYSNIIIPETPSYTYTNTQQGVTYKLNVPQQSGLFAEASSVLTLSNVKTTKSKCLVLQNGVPSTSCTPTTEPIVFQAGNVILKNNVIFSKESRVIVKYKNMKHSFPSVSPDAKVTLVSAPSTCYNNNAILMRMETVFANGKIKPYPNPVSGGVLYFGDVVSNYELVDVLGHSVRKGTEVGSLNTEGIPSGMYILKYEDQSEKIIIP